MSITDNYKKLRSEVPDYVTIVLAAKKRTLEEIIEVIEAGATDIGENYVQEAEIMFNALSKLSSKVRWHMIGTLQKNKINKALSVFDTIHTIDSLKKAVEVNKRAAMMQKIVPVLLEINIGSEFTKTGLKPEYEMIKNTVTEISKLVYLKLEGLMTMGPRFGDSEENRPYFKKIKEIFDKINLLEISNINMKYLSMGMSNSYKIAIEEGANMIRPGTVIFGER